MAEHDSRRPEVSVFHASFIRYPTDSDAAAELEKIEKNASRMNRIAILLGLQEATSHSLFRAILIEFVGTAVFIYMHISIALASRPYVYPPLLNGIFHGFLLTLYILQFAASSGAHFNSLITIATAFTRHTPPLRALLYVLAQCLGSFVGSICMAGSIPAATAESIDLASCSPGTATAGQAFGIEFFFSLNLLFAAYGMAFNAKQRVIFGPVLAPMFIGLTLCLNIFAGFSLFPPPFAPGFNPALCFGTRFALAAITDTSVLRDQWIYWIAPITAAVFHAVVYFLAPPHHQDEYAIEAQEKHKSD